jgi:hypothetical protein
MRKDFRALPEIDSGDMPQSLRGRTGKRYGIWVGKLLELQFGKSLPIVCEDKKSASSLRAILIATSHYHQFAFKIHTRAVPNPSNSSWLLYVWKEAIEND